MGGRSVCLYPKRNNGGGVDGVGVGGTRMKRGREALIEMQKQNGWIDGQKDREKSNNSMSPQAMLKHRNKQIPYVL